jgi:hypothetical protein
MKVTVERAQLLKSLGHVHRVVERRNTSPILGNVLVRADGAKLSLKATDLDLEVTETLAAETGTGGSTTVPAHMFYDIVRKLPDATLRGMRMFRSHGGTVRIVTGPDLSSEASVPGSDASCRKRLAGRWC